MHEDNALKLPGTPAPPQPPFRPSRWWSLALLALGAGLVGCRAEHPASRPLRVEFSGCASVGRGPVCRLGDPRRVRLWVEVPAGWEVRLDGRPPASPPPSLAGGLVLEPEIPSDAREVVVEARGGKEVRSWRLAVDASRPPAWFAAAYDLGVAGDFAGARRAVEPRLATPVAAERGLAWRIVALADLALGDGEHAETALRQAIAAHREAGELSRELEDGRSLAQRLILRREFTAARAVLEALPDPAGDAVSAHHRAYALGVLAAEVGDLRTALDRLHEAEEHAARAGRLLERIVAGQVLARELQWVGRSREANELFARLDAEAQPLFSCFRAQLRNNRAWALLLAREAGADEEDPKPLLDEALATFEGGCATFPDRGEERVNVRVNLALAHLQEGAPELARRRLAEARELEPRPDGDVLLWWHDLDARIHLAAGEPGRALAAWRGLAELAREAAAPEAAWRAAFGKARAHEALGEVPAALAAYRQAEEILERESLLVPMHQGRDTFLGRREEATRRHLDLLLRAGRPAEALAAARRARSRFLRTLEVSLRLASLPPAERRAWDRAVAAHQAERAEMDRAASESWRLPGDVLAQALEERARRLRELRGALDVLLVRFGVPPSTGDAALTGPAPGEVLLAWYPLPDGWVGFAADATGVTARRLGRFDTAAPPAVLAARLLAPLASPLAAARRVRVLPSGALRGVDVHTLPFGGAALLAAKPVVYGLDLASPGAVQPAPALVVGDPVGDLPAARAEVETIAATLSRGRGPVRALLGDEATGPAIRLLLAESGSFHYAGHAVFDGWNSFLRLAGEGRLTVDDVLALRHAPARVVLSGCETGSNSGEGGVESIGLAHAFLAAGAETVVAAIRPVPDREAAALMVAFYTELSRGSSPEEALRQAQLALRAGRRSAAGDAFRVFVP